MSKLSDFSLFKKKKETSRTDAYTRVRTARSNKRGTGKEFIERMFDNFLEMHGDRRFGDDPAIVAGVATLEGRPVTVIACEKGHSSRERVYRNFGAANPEGYRKALRLMKQAEKFHRPVICFVDTSGAFCGQEAEERGQAQAIAENLYEMSALKTPVLSIVTGEGGSGGALGLAVADEVWILENAVYSVISPEGCASILWKDEKRAPEAAECLCLTSEDIYDLGVADRIIGETTGLSGSFNESFYKGLKKEILQKLEELMEVPVDELVENRYARFRRLGNTVREL